MKRIVLLLAAILFVAGIQPACGAAERDRRPARPRSPSSRWSSRSCCSASKRSRSSRGARGRQPAGSAGRHQGAGRLRQLAARDHQQQGQPERLLQLQVLSRRLGRADGVSAASSRRADVASSSASSTSSWSSSCRTCRIIPKLPRRGRARGRRAEGEERAEGDISGEGQVAVENAWMEYNHNRLLSVRVGKQLSPQYWWQNHYPNLTLSTDAPHLPPRAVPGGTGRRDGAGVGGQARRHIRARRRLQVLRRQQQLRGQQPHRPPRRQVVGRARAGSLPDGRARCGGSTSRSISIAAMSGLTNNELAEDNVVGFETQLEVSQLPVSDRVGARQVAGADAHRLLPAAGAADRRRLDRVLPPGAARKPENPARRAAASRRA